MWIPKQLLSLVTSGDQNAATLHDAITYLREELAGVRMERDILKAQLAVSQTHFDWLRTRVNVLETERAALLEKATGIVLAVPQFVQAANTADTLTDRTFSFEDVGDDLAKKLGLN